VTCNISEMIILGDQMMRNCFHVMVG